jgi:hypothetical protein
VARRYSQHIRESETLTGRGVWFTKDGKAFYTREAAERHVERLLGLRNNPTKGNPSHGFLDEDSDEVLARGDVFLRVIFYNAMAPFKGLPVPKGQVAGYRTVMASAHNPTHKQAADWAYWAANKYNRGTTHLFPETYDIFTYRDPFFGRNVTVIDVGMGS